MAEAKYDAIVVGAGPAGSAFAALAAKAGANILLLDKEKFPRDKVCGDAVGGKALNVLARLGLENEIVKLGFLRSSGIVFSSPRGDVVEIPLLPSGNGMSGGFVCKRKQFDAMVFANAKKNCETIEGAEVYDVIRNGARIVGVKAKVNGGEKEFRAKLIVGADGFSSIIAIKAGVWKIEPDHFCSARRAYYKGVKGLKKNIEIHFLPECMPGYFWIFPLSDDEANVGVGMLQNEISRRKLNLDKVFDACINSKLFAGRFEGAVKEEMKGWSIPLASARRKCAGNGFILLGDAASLVDPFSGEGVGNGMKSAAIAADLLADKLLAGEIEEADCLEYEKKLWEEIGNDVKSSYNLQKLGKNKFLLNFIIGKAKKSELVRNELAGMIANKEAKKKATDPSFYLKIILS